jgi:hypothetical protein
VKPSGLSAGSDSCRLVALGWGGCRDGSSGIVSDFRENERFVGKSRKSEQKFRVHCVI